MPKKRKKRAGHPRTPNRPTIVRRHVEPSDAEAHPFIAELRRALRSDHPLEFLQTVSGLVAVTEPRPTLGSDPEPSVTLDQLVETFEGTDLAETTAALHVVAAFSDDEVMAARIRRTTTTRRQPMPAWLTDLGRARATRVLEMRHIQRDGDNYIVEIDLAGGDVMCAVIYIDNNIGGVVKDAFMISEGLEAYEGAVDQLAEPDTTLEPIDPATARAIVEQAIKHGAIMFPPPESETWPLIRPLVRWVARLLPPGGDVPTPKEWSDQELAELTEAFLSSPQGRPYDDEEHRSLLEDLLWFGVSQGTGDPLRWTPVNVEIVLADWYPRKVVADVALLAKLPDLLRAFVTYCHRREGLRRELTAETVASIDRWEPDYQQEIRTARPQGAEALARMLVDAESDYRLPVFDLADTVGGASALANLSTDPLPDEEFEWAGIPGDIHDKVAEILALCDQNADQFLDIEHRTANRRLLSRLAVADSAFFRGRAAAKTTASAISWMIAHANDSIGLHRRLTAQELLAPYGGGTQSERAARFRKVLGAPDHFPSYGPMALGSPDLLVAARRRSIIEDRDRSDEGLFEDYDDFDEEEFLAAWDEADHQAAEVLRDTVPDVLDSEPPMQDVAHAAERIRTEIAAGSQEGRYFAAACGWGDPPKVPL